MHGHLNCENYDETPDFGLPYKLSGLLSPFFFYPWSRPGQIERRIKNGTCCFCAGPMCKKRHNATYRRPNGLWRDANVCSLGLLSIILMMDQCDKHHLQSVENAVSKRLTWKYILMIYIYISNDIISYHINIQRLFLKNNYNLPLFQHPIFTESGPRSRPRQSGVRKSAWSRSLSGFNDEKCHMSMENKCQL